MREEIVNKILFKICIIIPNPEPGYDIRISLSWILYDNYVGDSTLSPMKILESRVLVNVKRPFWYHGCHVQLWRLQYIWEHWTKLEIQLWLRLLASHTSFLLEGMLNCPKNSESLKNFHFLELKIERISVFLVWQI